MKLFLTGVLLVLLSGVVMADCRTYLSHGQYKQDCNSSSNSNYEEAIEYSEVSRAGLIRSNKANRTQQKNNSEKQTHMAQLQATPHLKPEQMQQLVEYANNQGCQWKGTQHRPLLVCPK